VPVSVYVVEDVGVATGDIQVLHDKPVDGVHTYDVAPLAVKVVFLPAHNDTAAPALTIGKAFTVTDTC
jgi:hypothetical protein